MDKIVFKRLRQDAPWWVISPSNFILIYPVKRFLSSKALWFFSNHKLANQSLVYINRAFMFTCGPSRSSNTLLLNSCYWKPKGIEKWKKVSTSRWLGHAKKRCNSSSCWLHRGHMEGDKQLEHNFVVKPWIC